MRLEEIYNIIDSLSLSQGLKKRKEIKILPEYIDDNEEIIYMCTCILSGNNWLCIVTTKKILFLNKGIFNYVNKIQIPVENITYVTYRKYTMDGEVFIGQGDIAAVLTAVDTKDLKKLSDSIESVAKNLIKPDGINLKEDSNTLEIKNTKKLTRESLEKLLTKLIEENEQQTKMLNRLLEENEQIKKEIVYLKKEGAK